MTMYQYGPWDTKIKEHMEQLGKLLLAFTLRFSQSRNDPYKAGSESCTTLTAPEELRAPGIPTPSAPPEYPTKTGKTRTTVAIKTSVPPGKPEKLKPESTEKAGTSAPSKKPRIGKDKITEISETAGTASMTGTTRPTRPTGTTRTSKTSEKSAPPAKSKKLKTEKAETFEESAPSERPKIDTTETDETIGTTETTKVTQKPTSSKQSGNGKGKMVETTKGTEASGSSTATKRTGSTRKTLPFRSAGKLEDQEAE